ncbi:chromosomal replication initiator DnaA [Bradyrhizobium sp. 930_D9_N1_4]|uniref:chromosomal replication initiator DnaA n=1 Tax=Bradyrhizobium sp. 930_D9_N1_4 TaxID=3240374 RepID=UPI003F8CAC91
MAKLINPKIFSQEFGITSASLDNEGLLDPVLNADTKLFVDPLLLKMSTHPVLASSGVQAFEKRMSDIIELLAESNGPGDAPWKAAMKWLALHERSETCLGYGGTGTSGRDRPDSLKEKILTTAKQIVDVGVRNPELIILMGMFEAGVGPDSISDLTTNSILRVLEKITTDFCSRHSIPLSKFFLEFEEYELPANPTRAGSGIFLVPKDILRELPVATDWADIDRVVSFNSQLRHMVNQMIGNITKATVLQKKSALKRIALSDPQHFQTLIRDLLAGNPTGYDFEKDKKGFEALRQALLTAAQQYPLTIAKPAASTLSELVRVVGEITMQFKQLIENNNLSHLLWEGSTPRSEKSAQLVYFGVADSYCKANNLDISPEVHSGGGPVDFKFSSGYAFRVLVEIKLSTGSVAHGYETQIEIYKAASQTEEGLFLIINVGGMGSKLSRIQTIQQNQVKAGKKASEIVVVDATKKASASKR